MILYKLRCSNGHDFEAWFHDSASYSIQVDCGDVVCPFCSDTRVGKAVMAPHIGRHRASAEGEQSGDGERRAREVAEKTVYTDALRQFKWSVFEPTDMATTIRAIESVPGDQMQDLQEKGRRYTLDYLSPVSDNAVRAFLGV